MTRLDVARRGATRRDDLDDGRATALRRCDVVAPSTVDGRHDIERRRRSPVHFELGCALRGARNAFHNITEFPTPRYIPRFNIHVYALCLYETDISANDIMKLLKLGAIE